MVLLTALAAGLLVGIGGSRSQKRPWTLPQLRYLWLILVAFLPQGLAFYLPATRDRFPDGLAAAALITSQILLLAFCWLNRRVAGVGLLALGTALNLLVIAANGGFMPISPQTAARLVSPETLQSIAIGERFGIKDVLLLPEQTRLPWLSDVLLPPRWFPYQVAFSVGDLWIAVGAFWLTASQGMPFKTASTS